MTNRILFYSLMIFFLSLNACEKKSASVEVDNADSPGLKIAYVNGDSILFNFNEFRAESEAMEEKQRKAEEDLQKKGAALEREFITYQQQAQKGTMTGKEMEARENYDNHLKHDIPEHRLFPPNWFFQGIRMAFHVEKIALAHN